MLRTIVVNIRIVLSRIVELIRRDRARDDEGPWANGIWIRLADGEVKSWCSCAEPGKEVLACGHCGCGNSGLCWRCVVTGSGLEWRRKDTCA